MIAMALLLDPQVMIMDEPTTALDVVVQRGILQRDPPAPRRTGLRGHLHHPRPAAAAGDQRPDRDHARRRDRRAAARPTSIYRAASTRTPGSCSTRFPSLTGERGGFIRDAEPSAARRRSAMTTLRGARSDQGLHRPQRAAPHRAARGRRRVVHARTRPDGRARRRVRLGQVDDRADDRPAGDADRRARSWSPIRTATPVPDRDYRHRVQMVFQDPFASLNPFHTVEHHLARPLRLHGRAQRHGGAARQVERAAGPGDPAAGGGLRVRGARTSCPAASVSGSPSPGRSHPAREVLVADEPVSMLDVSIRLGVLNLLARLQREENLAVLYITHDLATARHFSDEILVLYRGRVVERGPADEVILEPRHPYTKLLAAASPNPEARGAHARRRPRRHGGSGCRRRVRPPHRTVAGRRVIPLLPPSSLPAGKRSKEISCGTSTGWARRCPRSS